MIHPRRLLLETPGVAATVPMLRGVWGAALHDLDPAAYRQVFDPGNGQAADAVPAYLMRPGPADPSFSPALDFLVFGPGLEHIPSLMRAWDVASGMGLGPRRRRFCLRKVVALDPAGRHVEADRPAWSLAELRWPVADGPCRIMFAAPLRLMRHKQLVAEPTLVDLVVAAGRRVAPYLPPIMRKQWDDLQSELREVARQIRFSPWTGRRCDFQRYSGRQHAEIEMHGVRGWLDLPDGPGELWPLLAAAGWLHLGKGTIFGLGQVRIEPLAP